MKRKLLKIEKRLRFVISTAIITVLFLFSTLFFFDKAFIFIPLLAFSTYLLVYFSLLEDIEKIEWLMLFLMPIFFVISTYLFYFLYPGRWLTRMPMAIFFAISFYALLLCSNIFNVGVEKSLQLYRPAFSVSVFYQLITLFFIFQVVMSFHFNFIVNGLLIGGIGLIMAIYFFWSINPKLYLDQEVIKYSGFVSLLLTELAVLFSFIPINPSIFSLFHVACYYVATGLVHAYLNRSLYKETIREYLIVFFIIFLIVLLTIKW